MTNEKMDEMRYTISIRRMTYEERLYFYEQDKKKLAQQGLNATEYEEKLIELIRKWKV